MSMEVHVRVELAAEHYILQDNKYVYTLHACTYHRVSRLCKYRDGLYTCKLCRILVRALM